MEKKEFSIDVVCPTCGEETYVYSTDDKHFSDDGTGYVNHDRHCKKCDKGFRVYTNFKYQITSQSIGK